MSCKYIWIDRAASLLDGIANSLLEFRRQRSQFGSRCGRAHRLRTVGGSGVQGASSGFVDATSNGIQSPPRPCHRVVGRAFGLLVDLDERLTRGVGRLI